MSLDASRDDFVPSNITEFFRELRVFSHLEVCVLILVLTNTHTGADTKMAHKLGPGPVRACLVSFRRPDKLCHGACRNT